MTLAPSSLLGAGNRKITDYKTVNTFLSSMLRGSIKSKCAYEYGLTHFQKFLSIEYITYGNKDNLHDMPRIVASGKDQVRTWEIEMIKSMSPKEREERKALLRSNKAFDELK